MENKSDNKIDQVYFIFQQWELLLNIKDLQDLNLSGSYQGEPHILPPNWAKPRQLNIYVTFRFYALVLRAEFGVPNGQKK